MFFSYDNSYARKPTDDFAVSFSLLKPISAVASASTLTVTFTGRKLMSQAELQPPLTDKCSRIRQGVGLMHSAAGYRTCSQCSRIEVDMQVNNVNASLTRNARNGCRGEM